MDDRTSKKIPPAINSVRSPLFIFNSNLKYFISLHSILFGFEFSSAKMVFEIRVVLHLYMHSSDVQKALA
jgi:hypothetical protein